MTTHAHQFDDPLQQHEAAILGIWTFLATEVLFFGGVLLAYAIYRFNYHNAFAFGSHQLKESLGGANTAVLLTSSLTVALAVHFTHLHRRLVQLTASLITLALGLAFLAIKGTEYSIEYDDHLIPAINFHLNAAEPTVFPARRTLHGLLLLPNPPPRHPHARRPRAPHLPAHRRLARFLLSQPPQHHRNHRPLLALRRPRLDFPLPTPLYGEVMPHAAKQSVPSLLVIHAALIILLLATIGANTLPLGPFSLVVALLIAVAKAFLVIFFFMHVRFASKVTWIFVTCGFLWLSMLFCMTFADYLTRTWSDQPRNAAIPIVSPPPGFTPPIPDPPPINFQP